MEVRDNITFDEIFETEIVDKKILLLQPNCDLHNQLRFDRRTKTRSIRTYEDLDRIKNTYWDYVISHAFFTRTPKTVGQFTFERFQENNISCDTLVVDELGEGQSITDDVIFTFDDWKLAEYLKPKKIKWLAPFEDYSKLEERYPNIEFFKSKFTGPRFFCAKTYQIIHGYKKEENGKVVWEDGNMYGNHLVAGLQWKPELKDKLFMCLNNEVRPHRTLMVHYLMQENLLNDGYVSYVKYEHEGVEEHEDQDIGIVRVETPKGIIHSIRVDTKRMLLPWEKELEERTSGKGNRFGIQTEVSEKSYIDVVTESTTGYWPFKTEKCMKPFYNLQFPIIYGHNGIIQDLRDIGFDMFDDIINHDYDIVEESSTLSSFEYTRELFQKTAWIDNIRIPKLTKELKRLSTLDIKKLYEDNKDRFIKNQELVWDLTIKNNKLLYEIGDFVFGDSIKYYDTDYSQYKKIYLNK